MICGLSFHYVIWIALLMYVCAQRSLLSRHFERIPFSLFSVCALHYSIIACNAIVCFMYCQRFKRQTKKSYTSEWTSLGLYIFPVSLFSMWLVNCGNECRYLSWNVARTMLSNIIMTHYPMFALKCAHLSRNLIDYAHFVGTSQANEIILPCCCLHSLGCFLYIEKWMSICDFFLSSSVF